MALRLNIIVASTRPGRAGIAIGKWFHSVAEAHGGFDAHLVDLAEYELPVFDEPGFPSSGKHVHDHTKRWAEVNAAGDAIAMVMPEYNHGPPGGLVNALNYLYNEWNYRPLSFVSYGGVSGGLRSVSVTKQLAVALRMVPVVEGVIIPNYFPLYEEGIFNAQEAHEKSANAALNELALLAGPLKTVREAKQAAKTKG
ncbi:MAG: NAD(P)H-dependent oxidoreductase [Pseudomonadota bacterium]